MLLVICLHAGLARFQEVTVPSAIGVLEYAARLLFEGVPVFLVVNGYLMLGSRHFEIHRHFRKTARLFVLLLFWMMFLTFVNSRILQEPLPLTNYWYEVFHTQVGSRYDGQLWFLENLLAVYLIYPVIRKLYDFDFHLFLYVFALFAFFSVGMNTVGLVRDGIALSHNTDLLNEAIGLICRFDPTGNAYYVYCFMLGGLIRRYREEVIAKRKALIPAGFLAWALITAIASYYSVRIGAPYMESCNYGSLAMTVMMLGMFALVLPHSSFKNPVLRLGAMAGQDTMGIFLIHFSFLDLWTMHVPLPDTIGYRVLEVVTVFLISWLVTLALKKIPGVRRLFLV